MTPELRVGDLTHLDLYLHPAVSARRSHAVGTVIGHTPLGSLIVRVGGHRVLRRPYEVTPA